MIRFRRKIIAAKILYYIVAKETYFLFRSFRNVSVRKSLFCKYRHGMREDYYYVSKIIYAEIKRILYIYICFLFRRRRILFLRS